VGIFFIWLVLPRPSRVCSFIDGSNFFNSAKRCFLYPYPNCDIAKMVKAVVALQPGRQLVSMHYYIGIPTPTDDKDNNGWWTRKLSAMGRTGVKIERRYLKKRELSIELSGVVKYKATVPKLQEKGIDLKLGLDMVRMTRERLFDVAILFSQDGDLVEAVEEVYSIAREQQRTVVVECAYPHAAGVDRYPIKRTTPIKVEKALYDSCIDPIDYRQSLPFMIAPAPPSSPAGS
jgi:uncharacterized LabA/DUF88 family protein